MTRSGGIPTEWEIQAYLRMAVPGRDTTELIQALSGRSSENSWEYLPSAVQEPDGTARAVGGTFTIRTETPGQAVDAALDHLRRTCEVLDIPVGDVDEINVSLAAVDPRA